MDPSNLTKNPSAIISTTTSGKGMNGVAAAPTQPPSTAATGSQKMSPPSIAPRLEVQPYHETLKGSLTKENWMAYTEALNKFLRGM